MTNDGSANQQGIQDESIDLEKLALDNCEREPVHIPGRVQTFGGMIACDMKTMQVLGYSDNLADVVPGLLPLKLGSELGEVIAERDLIHSIRGSLGLPTVSIQRERIGAHKIEDHFYDIALSVKNGIATIEFERVGFNEGRPDASVALVRSMLASLPSKTGPHELLDSAVTSLRRTTGFDRVMGYRFLSDDAGEVVAEAKSPGIEPYLGLRYPASDIPEVVRKLMVVNPFRIIADVEDPHAKLITRQGSEPIDLSLTHLRGVSPIHIEYLKNMGVRSVMHVSLIVRGKLWGLLSFHHENPLVLSPEKRSVVELFGHLMSLQLQQQLEQEVMDKRKKAESIFQSLNTSSATGLTELFNLHAQNFPKVISCEGAALINRDGILEWGRCPEKPVIESLTQLSKEHAHAVSSLVGIADSKHTNGICGAAVVELSQGTNSWLLLFRSEQIENVRWAGDTNKRIEYGPNGPRLHPRASFEEYAESVRDQSLPWTLADIEAAAQIATALRDAAYSSLDESQRDWNKQKEHKNLLIAELNHRVKNILALVRSIARQTEGSAASLQQYTRAFEKRIAALSTAHDLIGGSGLQWGSLRRLLETELRAFVHSHRMVTLAGPEIGLRADVAPLMALMFHELVSNSVKHGALSDAGDKLEISWKEEAGGLELIWDEYLKRPLAKPTRRGFGMTLIERSVPHECNGTCDIQFAESGLKVKFWLPSDSIRKIEGTKNAPKLDEPTRKAMPRKQTNDVKIIVVEDNTVLAVELESLLVSYGYHNVTLFNGVESCQNTCLGEAGELPDIGIFDINLSGTTSFALAEQLSEKGVSLIFASGYDVGVETPASLVHVPRLRKPIDNQELLLLLSTVEESLK